MFFLFSAFWPTKTQKINTIKNYKFLFRLFPIFDKFSWKSKRRGNLRYFAPKMATLKWPKKLDTLCSQIDETRAVGKSWLFLQLFGYTESDSHKSTKKDPIAIRSFSKFACHHFIAKWGCPQNLKKIGEVRDF